MWFAIERFGSITELRTGRRWTPAVLSQSVEARAEVLRARGIGRGHRVLIRQAGTGAFFADLFAVWRAGACAICVSPKLTAPEIETIAAFMGPSLLLCGDDEDPPPTTLAAARLGQETAGRRQGAPSDAASLDDDALMLLTSGTTGTPKGVVHSFRSVLARIALNRAVIGDDALRTTLCLLPVHFGHGLIGNCLTPLVAGHDLVIASDSGPALFGDLHRVIDEHAVTFMSSVPTTWRMVDRFCRGTPGRTLRRVHVGSAALFASMWRSVVDWCGTDDVVNAYGLTETANWVAGASSRDVSPEDGLVGRVWGGSAAVRTAEGTLSASGEGEIVLQVPSLMRGYFGRADLDAQTWQGGWFRTRDLGRVAADGTIHLLARLGDEINRGGTKVYPQDIEQLLDRHEHVAEACAFGFADDILGERVGVAVVLADAAGPLDLLKAWSASRLSREKLPDRWFEVTAIPKTDRGKVNRAAVAALCLGTPNAACAATREREK